MVEEEMTLTYEADYPAWPSTGITMIRSLRCAAFWRP